MKININRMAFADSLALLTSVVPSRTPKPVLRCVRLTAAKDTLRLRATDLEVGLNLSLSQVEVVKTGDVVVPADRLAAIVRESTDETLCLEAQEGSCKITGADSHFTILGQPEADFPQVPALDGQADLEVGLQNLQAAINMCLFATARESTRYALNGVLWEVKGKKLSLVATDGRRLAKSRINLAAAASKDIETAKIIVPSKTLGLLQKLTGSDKDVVSVKLSDNQILFSCQTVVISSNLVEGTFPKYEDIIPADYNIKLKLSTEAVLSAVRRAALLTTEESRGIKLAVGKGLIVFTSRSPEMGDAQIDMAVDYKGEPIEVGFNPQFLVDVLRVLPEPEFELELGQADRPGLIKCGKDFLYVLMPISLG